MKGNSWNEWRNSFLRHSVIFFTLTILCQCSYELDRSSMVYENDFEDGDLTGITGGVISDYNEGIVIGTYYDNGFELELEDLPDHEFITIKASLYIHDTWDGNAGLPGGPDLWWVKLDNSTRDQFITSFSNSSCSSLYCLQQSFPEGYPFFTNPKTSAEVTSLPRFCHEEGTTTLYHIEVTFPHKSTSAKIEFHDDLTQTNAIDKQCDESWSIDDMEISVWSI